MVGHEESPGVLDLEVKKNIPKEGSDKISPVLLPRHACEVTRNLRFPPKSGGGDGYILSLQLSLSLC